MTGPRGTPPFDLPDYLDKDVTPQPEALDALNGPTMKHHGHTTKGTKSPTYCSWRCMMARCYTPSTSDYWRYGGRGITVCQRWHDFRHFLADMGKRPIGHTLDRLDSNQGYEPENVRWATSAEQNRHRDGNHWIRWKGQLKCVTDWAHEQGMNPKTLWGRLRRGWEIGVALTFPVSSSNGARYRGRTRKGALRGSNG